MTGRGPSGAGPGRDARDEHRPIAVAHGEQRVLADGEEEARRAPGLPAAAPAPPADLPRPAPFAAHLQRGSRAARPHRAGDAGTGPAGLLRRYTSRTIADPAALRLELDRIRRRGYAISEGHMSLSAVSVAAPIHDETDAVTAALTVAMSVRGQGLRRTDRAQRRPGCRRTR